MISTTSRPTSTAELTTAEVLLTTVNYHPR